MDPLTTAAGNYLVSMGLPGIVILGLSYAYYLERKSSREERQRLQDVIFKIQEQRVTDATAQTRAIESNTATTAASTTAITNLTNYVIAKGAQA
jgi:hypothetical protein